MPFVRDVDPGEVSHLDPWDLKPELTCNVGFSISEYMLTIPLSEGILDIMNDPLTSKIDLASSLLLIIFNGPVQALLCVNKKFASLSSIS